MDMLSEIAREHVSIENSRSKRAPQNIGTAPVPHESRRDRRQREMIEKLIALTNDFVSQRAYYFENQFASPNLQLSSLIDGTNEDFNYKLQLFEAEHKKNLEDVEIFAEYLSERLEREYETEITAAEKDYQKCKEKLKQLLLTHLQSKKKRLREDKEFLDIAADSSLLGLAHSGTEDPNGYGDGLPMDRRKRRQRRTYPTSEAVESEHLSESIAIEELLALCGLSNDDKPLAGRLLDNLSLTVARGSERERERDSRALDKSERERDKAVESGLSSIKEQDVMDDLNEIRQKAGSMLQHTTQTTHSASSSRRRRHNA